VVWARHHFEGGELEEGEGGPKIKLRRDKQGGSYTRGGKMRIWHDREQVVIKVKASPDPTPNVKLGSMPRVKKKTAGES